MPDAQRTDGPPGPRPARLLARGPGALEQLGVALDGLHRHTGAPVTARRDWLQRWSAAHPEVEPVLVAVGLPSGGLTAAAPLAVSRRRGMTRVALLGAPHSDYLRLPARDDDAATALAAAVTAFLQGLRGPWVLDLEQLPAGDPVAARLATALPTATLEPGDGAPRLRLRPGAPAAQHVSSGTRRAVRQGWNRLRADGHDARAEHLRDAAAVRALLPALREVHRAREHDVGRVDDLGRAGAAAFWTSVVTEGAARGGVALAVLWDGDRVAAYELALVDGTAYRLWDGRFHPDYARYGPGRLLQVHLVEELLAEGRWTELDLMRGVEEYKLRLADDVVPAERLRAWSSRRAWWADEAPRRLRAAARDARHRSSRLDAAWVRVKQRTVAR